MMPQQIIVAADGSVQIIETGPIGPPGFFSGDVPDSGGADGNEIAAVGAVIYEPTFTLPDETDIEAIVNGPSQNPVGITIAFVGFGDPYDGIYMGGTLYENGGDPELWEPMVRLGDLPLKLIFSRLYVTELGVYPEEGVFYTDKGAEVIWNVPINMLTGTPGTPGDTLPKGEHTVDLTAEAGLAYPSAWESEDPPEGSVVMPLLYPPEGDQGPDAVRYLEVDLSVLPDDKDTLVLLVPDGQWNIIPTAWPSASRGPWSLNVRFETIDPYNLVMMGTTVEEIIGWGFTFTPHNPTLDFHTTVADAWTRTTDPSSAYLLQQVAIELATHAALLDGLGEIGTRLTSAEATITDLVASLADAVARIDALEGA